jgi:hypothetical protein
LGQRSRTRRTGKAMRGNKGPMPLQLETVCGDFVMRHAVARAMRTQILFNLLRDADVAGTS